MSITFSRCHDASLFAKMEFARTGWRHIVKPCKAYICPPQEYYGRDWKPAFCVVLGHDRTMKARI